MSGKKASVIWVVFAFLFFWAAAVFAHCDTMDGPLIADARKALAKGEVTPVLKWVEEERETQVKKAFHKALSRSKKRFAAQEKAEMRFFKVLVKIHRQGEGAKFKGLKPAGTLLEPAVKEADAALEEGSSVKLIKLVTEDAALGLSERFAKVAEKKKHKDESVKAGREFVRAYIEFVDYAENLHRQAVKDASGEQGKDKAHNTELYYQY